MLFKGKNPASALTLHWEAPSIGVGTGLTASKVCILVYGTSDSSKLLATFGSAEGSAHWLAGASVSLLSNLAPEEDQRIDLADVAVGVGFDFTARLEGLTFSTENKWLP